MFRFLADENFNGDIVRGIHFSMPSVDLIRIQDVRLAGIDDPGLLAWAAEHDRIVLTHDRATMPDFAYHRVKMASQCKASSSCQIALVLALPSKNLL